MSDTPSDPSRSSTAEWERLSTLFEAAQSLPAESREQYLDAVCAANPALRAELEALLASASDAPAFFRDLAATAVAPVLDHAMASNVDDPASDVTEPFTLSGTRVRHYDVGPRIGIGGMGIVYRARDTRLHRDVALKFLSPSRFADAAARRQLIREAQAVSALDDPHVCPIYAIEDTDDGGICLVMAYCGGGTLREKLRSQLLPIAETVRIATQIATGLACAHRNGLVHRDLKPANIGFADRDMVKVLDFGVAARTIGHASTGTLTLAGTLPYMAPEVLRGELPDARADVWALGVTMYELLTGRRPFVGNTDAAVLYAILEQRPAPLERADGAVVPEPLAQLVSELLAKSPTARPADGTAVLARLQQLSTPSPSASPSTTPTATMAERLPEPITHVRRPGIAWAAVAGLALIGTVFFWRSRSSPSVTDAVAPLEVARVAAPLPTVAVIPFLVQGDPALDYLTEGMVDLLTPAFDATGLVRGMDPNAVIGADPRPDARRGRNVRVDSALAREWAVRLGASRYVVGSVVRTGASLTVRATLYLASGEERGRSSLVIPGIGDLSSGVDGLVRQLIGTELRAPGDTLSALAAATTRSSTALRAYMDGERELRDARPAAAVTYFEQAVAADSSFALAWYRLARAAKWNEVDSLNRVALERAFALSASLPPRLQSIVRAYHAIRLGSPRNAERLLRQTVADFPNDVEAWMLLGELLFENNPYAGRASDEATAVFRKVMGLDPRNREVTVYLMELAARANRTGELDTLFTMYFTPNSAGEQPGIRRTYLALHARRIADGTGASSTGAGAAQRANAQVDDPATALTALRRVGADVRDLTAAKAFAQSAASPSSSPTTRVEGLLSLASLAMAEQRYDSALVHWQTASGLDANAVVVAQTLAALAPNTPMPTDSLRALQQRLLRLTSSKAMGAMGVAANARSATDQEAILLYLAGVLSVRLGDRPTVERVERALSGIAARSSLSLALRQAVRGHQALAQQRYADAIAAFAAAMVDVPARDRTLIPALQQQVDRLAYAQALRAIGRPDEATAWRVSLGDGPAVWSAPYLGSTRE